MPVHLCHGILLFQVFTCVHPAGGKVVASKPSLKKLIPCAWLGLTAKTKTINNNKVEKTFFIK
jgi:hypothetical protein